LGHATVFYCLRFETSLFVASYDSHGHGGGIRPRLHTGVSTALPAWGPRYIASKQTQQKTSPPTIYFRHGRFPSDRLDIVSAGTYLPTVAKQCMFLLAIVA
jgi:hypothetical protein